MTKLHLPGSGHTEMVTGIKKMRVDWFGKGYTEIEEPVRVTYQKDVATYEQSNGWLIHVRNTWDLCTVVRDGDAE